MADGITMPPPSRSSELNGIGELFQKHILHNRLIADKVYVCFQWLLYVYQYFSHFDKNEPR